LRIIAEENILVMMGEVLSKVTEPLHYVLRGSKVSQASPVSTTMALSDRKEFPFYWRTVPADATLYTALVQTLKSQFNWNNVAAISSGEEEVDLSASVFADACSRAGINVVTAKGLQNLNATSVETALSQIKDTGARVIFAALSVDAVRPIFEAARKLDMYSPTSGFIWVLNFIPHILDDIDPAVAALIPEGCISVAPAYGIGSQYQKFLNGTRQKSADARLNPMLSTSYIYDTALLVMHAVRAIDGRGQNYYDRNLFYAELNKVDFVGATGRVALKNGDRLHSEVSVVRRTSGAWEEFVHHSFGGASIQDLASSVSVMPYKFADPATSIFKDLSLNYMKWQDGAGLALVLITSLLLLCILGSAILVFFWRNNVMIRASSPAFLQVLLVGVTLAIISVFPSTGELSDASCTVRTWLFVLGFVMSYGACLLKNWRVYRLWSDASMRIIRISNLHLVGYSSIFMIPFTLLLIVWTVIDKPSAVIRGANLICEPGKSIVWSLLEFIGIGLMLVAGVVLAFMTRAIPQLYNECKHIALASYNLTFCLVIGVALSFILQPVSITAAYVCYAIGVLFAFGGLWAIVLGPKLYLIIFRPDKVAELSSGHSSSRSAKASRSSSRTSATASTPGSSRPSTPSSSRPSSSPKESGTRMQGRGGSGNRSSSKSSTKQVSYVSTKSSTKEESSSSSSSE
jgi:ABC-type branched-subunit amino acid transport system substrate-binding protein